MRERGNGLGGGFAGYGIYPEQENQYAFHVMLLHNSAQREVEEALGTGRGPGGMTQDEVEAKFRALEYGSADTASPARSEVDDELQALKKRIRIETK